MRKLSILVVISVLYGLTARDALADERPLLVAKRLAQTRFNGWKYGSDASKKQIDCVQFVLAVVEETVHRRLETTVRARILISDLSEPVLKRGDYGLVVGEDPRTKGVQEALVGAQLGERVAAKDAAPGDLIQYWMQQRDGSWFGHCAIIETVVGSKGDPRATLFGSHRSLNGIGTSDFELVLTASPKRRLYIVRLK